MANNPITSTKSLNYDKNTVALDSDAQYDYFQNDYFQNDYFQIGNVSAMAKTITIGLNFDKVTIRLDV